MSRLEELQKAVDEAGAWAAKAAYDAAAWADYDAAEDSSWAAYDAALYAYYKARQELKAYKMEHGL
tara:strand:- start:67 stop:264 length:198 start_codon:yes stop_codon:yes gene_type:complete